MENVNEEIGFDEFELMQNQVLGAHALREFVKFYQRVHVENIGPSLLLILPVLPLVYNQVSTQSISNKHYIEGSIYKALREDKTLFIGLQARMEKMYEQTLQSVFMAANLGLLEYDVPTTRLTLSNGSNPSLKFSEDYETILRSSRRLGSWFAQMSESDILETFRIQF